MRRTNSIPVTADPEVQDPRDRVVALLYRGDGAPDVDRVRARMASMPDGRIAELAMLLGALFKYPLGPGCTRVVYEAGILEALGLFQCRKRSFLRVCLGNLDDRQVRRLAVLLAGLGMDGDGGEHGVGVARLGKAATPSKAEVTAR